MTPHQSDAPQSDRRLASVVLGSLFPGPVTEASARDRAIITTAQSWQETARLGLVAEGHGVVTGTPEGRIAEIFGHMGGVGEQLGLASSCSRDARQWLARDVGDNGRTLGARATAEITGYYTLGAAHGLFNITLRVLLLNKAAAASLAKSFKRAAGFPPFSTATPAWPSFSQFNSQALADAAVAAGAGTDVSALVSVLQSLITDGRWSALVSRRGVDFHRWRPQSVEGGLAQENPWTHASDGSSHLRIGTGTGYATPDAGLLVAEADAALDALVESVVVWESHLAASTHDLGVPLLRR